MTTIALLTCGRLTGKPLTEAGDYDSIYLRYMQQSSPPGTTFTFHPYDVREKMEYPVREDDYTCMLLTGSASSAYDNIEWINKLVDYVKRIAETKPHIKLIGFCFGHQIIARALGGECVVNGGGWEVGPTPIQLTELGRRLFNVDTVTLNQMHRDHVSKAPPNFDLLGSTALTPNQGMVRFLPVTSPNDDTHSSTPAPLPKIQILSVQGHPEFTDLICFSILEQRASAGVIDAATAEDAERRRPLKTDGVDVVGKVVWDVILQ